MRVSGYTTSSLPQERRVLPFKSPAQLRTPHLPRPAANPTSAVICTILPFESVITRVHGILQNATFGPGFVPRHTVLWGFVQPGWHCLAISPLFSLLSTFPRSGRTAVCLIHPSGCVRCGLAGESWRRRACTGILCGCETSGLWNTFPGVQ